MRSCQLAVYHVYPSSRIFTVPALNDYALQTLPGTSWCGGVRSLLRKS